MDADRAVAASPFRPASLPGVRGLRADLGCGAVAVRGGKAVTVRGGKAVRAGAMYTAQKRPARQEPWGHKHVVHADVPTGFCQGARFRALTGSREGYVVRTGSAPAWHGCRGIRFRDVLSSVSPGRRIPLAERPEGRRACGIRPGHVRAERPLGSGFRARPSNRIGLWTSRALRWRPLRVLCSFHGRASGRTNLPLRTPPPPSAS